MPRLVIDNRTADVPQGGTILDAARQLRIEVPTLCFLEGCTPSTSCMVCVVKLRDHNRLVPSCAMRAEEGMHVESQTDEVLAARRSALELLLSDHPADCIAPCQTVCPARMEIPKMLRQIRAGDLAAAAATSRTALVLPATLGRICPAPCEKGCRRAGHDGPVAIRLGHRHAADAELASGRTALPKCKPPLAKRAAIIGAGPAGLAAAWRLLQEGCACTIFDDHEKPGGMLRHGVPEDRLPREVLDAEIGLVARLGAEFRMGVRVGRNLFLGTLRKDFDAVLIATGAMTEKDVTALGLEPVPQGVEADRRTFQTPDIGVFVAGDALQPRRMAVRAVGEGHAAAVSVIQYLTGEPVTGPARPFTTRLGVPTADEMVQFLSGASADARTMPAAGELAGLSADEARREAARCLHCDCRKAGTCKLRRYAEDCGASPNRYHGTRRAFEQDLRHAEIVYEPGKCISCGLCIQVAEKAGERLGLTFIGRGFTVRVGVPLGGQLQEGLRKSAADCVAACPTGALAFKVQR